MKNLLQHLPRILRFCAWWALAGAAGFVMVAASAVLYISPKLPSRESYTNIRLENPLRIFTSDGKLLAEFGSRRSNPVKYDEIPPLVIQALVSSEDKRFYDHNGVDSFGLLRSIAGIITGNDWGGGSTITMQVTKNFFFEGESPYTRKPKEILLAIKMERELSKEEILELYLNRTFFGISAYGIKAAARQYYDKEVNDLSLAEIATLIGIMPRPNSYNPLESEELALNERRRVLRRMRDQDMIAEAEFDAAWSSAETARRYGRQPDLEAPYIAEMARIEMEQRYGPLALTDGFEVYTTIDSRMQGAANRALVSGLENYDRNHGYRGRENHMRPADDGSVAPWLEILARTPAVAGQMPAFVQEVSERSITALLRNGESVTIEWDGIRWAKPFITSSAWGSSPRAATEVAQPGDLIRVKLNDDGKWVLGQVPDVNGGLVALDPNTGAIRALSGGYDFTASTFNRVTQARRQPGSNFKPFLYAAALANGYTPATLINDAPLARSDYRPGNFEGNFMGPIRLKYALTQSKNLVSLRLYEALGEDIVIPYFGRFGFKAAEIPRNDLTVAIGSHAVLPLEIATGYAVFANGGYKIEPYLIERVVNFNDGEVFRARPSVVCKDCNGAAPPSTSAGAQVSSVDGAPSDAASGVEPLLANQTASDFEPAPPAPRVIDERTAYIMNTILRGVITEGSGRPVSRALDRQDLAGKTGTTNDAFDLWFSGFNADLVATVYVGYDQPQSLGSQEQAATVSTPIWIDFMKVALEGMPERSMPQPDGLVTVRINSQTGLRAGPNEPGAIFETFREEDLPPYGNTPTQTTTVQPGSPQRQSEPVSVF
ncbi:MAG TPA: PBP1A family penicillin-binding protein [Pseudomonadales bacterium]